MAERGDELRRVASTAQVAGGDVAGAVDGALDLPALVEVGEFAGLRVGQARGGHVEETVEVDAQRAVHEAAQQLARRHAHEGSVQRVRGGEGVVDGVPVAEVVLHVEAGDAQRGGVGEGPAELVGIGAGGERVEQGVDNMFGVVVEELPGEAGHVGERAVPGGARVDGGVEAGLRARDQLGEVVRVAPGAGLLRPGGQRRAAHEGGQHVGGGVAADVAERLEGLVGEVDGVTAVDEDVVGDGGEHHALDVAE